MGKSQTEQCAVAADEHPIPDHHGRRPTREADRRPTVSGFTQIPCAQFVVLFRCAAGNVQWASFLQDQQNLADPRRRAASSSQSVIPLNFAGGKFNASKIAVGGIPTAARVKKTVMKHRRGQVRSHRLVPTVGFRITPHRIENRLPIDDRDIEYRRTEVIAIGNHHFRAGNHRRHRVDTLQDIGPVTYLPDGLARTGIDQMQVVASKHEDVSLAID